MVKAAASSQSFGVYVHWPYCARICPYCDFNVYAAKQRDTGPLLDAIRRDLAGWRDLTGPRTVSSIFFGGGTPSLLKPGEVADLKETIAGLWDLDPHAEITLEANPDDVDRLAAFAVAGVDRLSLGVQSLDDTELKFLGRTHSADQAIMAFEKTRGAFRSVSLDFIYGLPGQSLDKWRKALGEILALGADHLSLYELSIEPGAAFAYAVRRGEWTPAGDDHAADLYELTQEMCAAAGLPAYEISNHARGAEHESVHNRLYWASGDWAGVGPGAHGRFRKGGLRQAAEAERRPPDYIARVNETGLGFAPAEALSKLDEARERVAMGLRVREGLAPDCLDDLGLALNGAEIADLRELGLIDPRENRVALTTAGRLAADRVAGMITP